MTILHLGHQPADIGIDPAQMSTTSGYFDAALDVNAAFRTGINTSEITMSLPLTGTSANFWLGFRIGFSAFNATNNFTRDWLMFYDAQGRAIAKVMHVGLAGESLRLRPSVWDGSAWVDGSFVDTGGAIARWLDFNVVIGANVTLTCYLNGGSAWSATATNGASFTAVGQVLGKFFSQTQGSGSVTVYLAHIAAMDGVSTINRRFVRMRPNAAGYVNNWAGTAAAVGDGLLNTSMTSSATAQRTAFTVASPTIPAHTAIAGLHFGIVGEGVTGRTRIKPFTRHSGTNHDAASAAEFPPGGLRREYVTIAQNPATSAAWTQATLPNEYGLLSEA